MNSPITSEALPGGGIHGRSRGRSIFPIDRPLVLGLSAGQLPVLMHLFKGQNNLQEIVVRNYHHRKETIHWRVRRIPESARFIRGIIDPESHTVVSFFLTERDAYTTPVVRDIDPEWEARPGTGFSCRERETLYTLRHTAAQDSCPVIKKSGDLSCAEE